MKQQSSPYRYVILGIVLMAQSAFGLNFFAVSPLFPTIMDEFGLARAAAGLLIGLVVLVMALFGLPLSLLANKFGLKRVFAVGLFLVSAGVLAPLAPSFPALLVLRLLLGLGMAIVVPMTLAVVMAWFPSERFPLINTMTTVWQSLGVAVGMFITVPLAAALGWDNTLAVYGVVGLAVAVAWLLLGKTPSAPTAIRVPPLREVLHLARQRNTIVLGLGFAGSFSFYTSMSSWLPTFFSEAKGMSEQEAGFVTGLLPFVGILGTVLGGVLAAWVGRRRPFLIVTGGAMLASGLGGFLVGPPLLYLVVAAMGFVGWLYLVSAFTLPMELPGMTPQRLGVMMATSLGIGNLANFASPLMVGALTDATGSYIPGFTVLSVMALSISVAGYLLPETGPKARAVSAGTVLAPK